MLLDSYSTTKPIQMIFYNELLHGRYKMRTQIQNFCRNVGS